MSDVTFFTVLAVVSTLSFSGDVLPARRSAPTQAPGQLGTDPRGDPRPARSPTSQAQVWAPVLTGAVNQFEVAAGVPDRPPEHVQQDPVEVGAPPAKPPLASAQAERTIQGTPDQSLAKTRNHLNF